jgi:hypothetical protein
LPKKPDSGHEHQAHRAIAADVVADPGGDALRHEIAVDRIEHDDRILLHAKGTGSVDPVSGPSGLAKARMHFLGVVAALTADEDLHLAEGVDVVRVLDGVGALSDLRRLGPLLRGGEEVRVDAREVLLGEHALDEHRTDHAAKPDDSYSFHLAPGANVAR